MNMQFTQTEQAEKAERLRALHHGQEPLVLVNVWDAITTKVVERSGAAAIATTSAGIAFAEGVPDGEQLPRDTMLARVATIARSTNLPVTADLEAGYGTTAEGAAELARGAIGAGAVGLNLEDRAPGAPSLLATDVQAARIRALRAESDRAGVRLVINARNDFFLMDADTSKDRLDAAIERGRAYIEAGADSFFVPGLFDRSAIAYVVQNVPGPVNVLVNPHTPPIADLRKIGVKRVSLGSVAITHVMWALQNVAREVYDSGTFSFADKVIPYRDLNAWLRE
ncbi:MAG: isocitrate lyase/PEP mutase family protein [Vulcanimicrobiaceae bacterium]